MYEIKVDTKQVNSQTNTYNKQKTLNYKYLEIKIISRKRLENTGANRVSRLSRLKGSRLATC